MDRDELRRLATEATGLQSHVFLRTPDLVNLLDALERAEALREEAAAQADICHANHEGAIRDLRERLRVAERERDEARANYTFMVERAANQKLDGYRELGARAAAAEERAEKAERERDALRHHYDKAGPEHNLLALLDMYDERRAAAESERDAYKRAKEENDERFMRERDEWKARHDTLADVSRACIATAERERDEARAERDARPDISAEDAALVLDVSGLVGVSRVYRALMAHAARRCGRDPNGTVERIHLTREP